VVEIKLGNQMKRLMEQAGISIKTLSNLADVPVKTLYGWTAGNRPRDIMDVMRVAETLNVSLEELLFGRKTDGQSSPMKDCQQEIAKWLKTLRQRMRFSFKEVSHATNLPVDMLMAWEEKGDIPIAQLIALTAIYQVPSEVVAAKLIFLTNRELG